MVGGKRKEEKMLFSIQKELFDLLPDLTIGVVVAKGVDNTHPSPEIEQSSPSNRRGTPGKLSDGKSSGTSEDKALEDGLFETGHLGSKFPSSIESMARRVLRGDPFPKINPLVDLYNSVSLKYLVPMGGHDLDTLQGKHLSAICRRLGTVYSHGRRGKDHGAQRRTGLSG